MEKFLMVPIIMSTTGAITKNLLENIMLSQQLNEPLYKTMEKVVLLASVCMSENISSPLIT